METGITHYVELEPRLVAIFGKGAQFLANKVAALQFVRESYATQLRYATGPVAFESTGVSDRALIDALRARHVLLLVHVATPKATCVARVAGRPDHLNIGNDVDAAARFYDFWYAQVAPSYRFAATVDGTDVESAGGSIASLLQGVA
jgi:hypothetical protein